MKKVLKTKGIPKRFPRLGDYKRTVPPGGLLNPGLRQGGGLGLKIKKV